MLTIIIDWIDLRFLRRKRQSSFRFSRFVLSCLGGRFFAKSFPGSGLGACFIPVSSSSILVRSRKFLELPYFLFGFQNICASKYIVPARGIHQERNRTGGSAILQSQNCGRALTKKRTAKKANRFLVCLTFPKNSFGTRCISSLPRT